MTLTLPCCTSAYISRSHTRSSYRHSLRAWVQTSVVKCCSPLDVRPRRPFRAAFFFACSNNHLIHSWNAPPLNLLPLTFLMLKLLPPRPMPHATTSDPPVDLLPRWQTLKDLSITLPRPHAQQFIPPKPIPTAGSGLVTPPSDMNGVARSSNVYPQHHSTMSGENTASEFRPKIPAIQPAIYSLSSSSAKYGSSYRETGSPLQKTSVPSVNNGEQQTGRRSSAGNSNTVAPSLRLPSTVQAPQSSMPQLAAEVRVPQMLPAREAFTDYPLDHLPLLVRDRCHSKAH